MMFRTLIISWIISWVIIGISGISVALELEIADLNIERNIVELVFAQ